MTPLDWLGAALFVLVLIGAVLVISSRPASNDDDDWYTSGRPMK